MASPIGNTITTDPQMNTLVTALKVANDQVSSLTDSVTQLTAQITTMQNAITQYTSETTLYASLAARITALDAASTSSANIAADPQCFAYGASIGNNQTTIANINGLIPQLQQNLAVLTQQQSDAVAAAASLLAQVSARMDVLRGITSS